MVYNHNSYVYAIRTVKLIRLGKIYPALLNDLQKKKEFRSSIQMPDICIFGLQLNTNYK